MMNSVVQGACGNNVFCKAGNKSLLFLDGDESALCSQGRAFNLFSTSKFLHSDVLLLSKVTNFGNFGRGLVQSEGQNRERIDALPIRSLL